MTKISIVIVSWNTRDLLRECLQSIYKYGNDFELEVFVVDNNSSDDTVEMLKKEFAHAYPVQIIENKKNLGFAKANNQGLQKATGDYILLLNPDTEIFKDTLAQSVKFIKENKSCGIMGCQMLYADQTLQPSVRRFPRVWPVFLMLLKLPKIFPRLKSINKYLAVDFNYTKSQIVDQVMGAYMFMPRVAFKKIGLMDERFFIWFEEVDYCRRTKEAGYKVMYNPDVKIIHHGGQSFNQQKVVKKQWRFFVSALKYFITNFKF